MEEIFEIRSCIEILANDIKVDATDEYMFYASTGPDVVWLIEQCFTSPPTQYRLYGRRFLQVKRPNQGTYSTHTNQTYNNQTFKRCRVTTLIETNALPLSQPTTCNCISVYNTTYTLLNIINHKRYNTQTEVYLKLYGSKNYNTFLRWSDTSWETHRVSNYSHLQSLKDIYFCAHVLQQRVT